MFKISFNFQVSLKISANLYLGAINIRLSPQIWVDWRRFVSHYLFQKSLKYFTKFKDNKKYPHIPTHTSLELHTPLHALSTNKLS